MSDPETQGVCPLCNASGGAIPVLLEFQDRRGEVYHVGAVLDDEAHPKGGGERAETRQVLQPGAFLTNFKVVTGNHDHAAD